MSLPNQRDIPEISSTDEQALEEALQTGQPVIVRGLAAHWPAITVWTQEYLTERLGEKVLPAYEGVSGAFPDPQGMKVLKVRFSEYLESLWSGSMEKPALLEGDSALIFAGSEDRSENFAVLEDDIELPSFIAREDLRQIGFWLSCQGVNSWLHYDNNLLDNINVQVKGSKQVTLFDPDDAARLYLNTFTGEGVNRAQFSKVDLRAPDVESFPELANAQGWVGTIHAGDVVFIPSCWFHGFGHLGEINLNVNFWWQPKAIAWNAITVRRSWWRAVERTLANGEGSVPTATRLRQLPEEARSVIEQLERTILSPTDSGYL